MSEEGNVFHLKQKASTLIIERGRKGALVDLKQRAAGGSLLVEVKRPMGKRNATHSRFQPSSQSQGSNEQGLAKVKQVRLQE